MIVLRHGPVATPGTCYGRSDPPLAERPAVVAQRVGPGLPGEVGACWSSPSPRCRDLATALVGVERVTVAEALAELDFGQWEGVPWDEVDRAGLDAWAADPLGHRMPGGESGHDVHARVAAWVRSARPGPGDLVVAHAGSLRALAAVVLGVPFDTTWQWPVPHAVPLVVTPTGFAPVTPGA